MEISIVFENPLEISQAGDKDKLRISFIDTKLLFDVFGQDIEKELVFERIIPTQFASEAEAEVFNSLEESVGTVDTGYFASNVFINAVIAFTLQGVWSMLESQQIIVLFPLFEIILPANAKSVFSLLLQIAAFDAMPTEQIWDGMLKNLESQTKGQD